MCDSADNNTRARTPRASIPAKGETIMLNYCKIFQRASTSEEKRKADKIWVLLGLGKVKDAVDMAERFGFDAQTLARIERQQPTR